MEKNKIEELKAKHASLTREQSAAQAELDKVQTKHDNTKRHANQLSLQPNKGAELEAANAEIERSQQQITRMTAEMKEKIDMIAEMSAELKAASDEEKEGDGEGGEEKEAGMDEGEASKKRSKPQARAGESDAEIKRALDDAREQAQEKILKRGGDSVVNAAAAQQVGQMYGQAQSEIALNNTLRRMYWEAGYRHDALKGAGRAGEDGGYDVRRGANNAQSIIIPADEIFKIAPVGAQQVTRMKRSLEASRMVEGERVQRAFPNFSNTQPSLPIGHGGTELLVLPQNFIPALQGINTYNFKGINSFPIQDSTTDEGTSHEFIEPGAAALQADLTHSPLTLIGRDFRWRLDLPKGLIANTGDYDLISATRNALTRLYLNRLDKVMILSNTSRTGYHKGFLNTDNILITTLGTDGGALTLGKVNELEISVLDNSPEDNGLHWFGRAGLGPRLNQLYREANSADAIYDGLIGGEKVQMFRNHRFVANNNIPGNLTKGAGTGLEAMVFADLSHWHFATFGDMMLTLNPYSGQDTGSIRFYIEGYYDFGFPRPGLIGAIRDMI